MTTTTHMDESATYPVDRPDCGRSMRESRSCNKLLGHRGRCSSVAWECDGCGRRVTNTDKKGPRDEDGFLLVVLCFLCVKDQS